MNPQKELKIQQGIRESEDELVQLIEAALDKATYGDLQESQFRNLVRVADTTSSAEVIKNFLRYQTGRDEKWGRGKTSLAERIIQDIGNVDRGGALIDRAKQIAKAARKSERQQPVSQNSSSADDTAQETDISAEFKQIWIELIRRYLGYGSRYLKYQNVNKKEQSNPEASPQE